MMRMDQSDVTESVSDIIQTITTLHLFLSYYPTSLTIRHLAITIHRQLLLLCPVLHLLQPVSPVLILRPSTFLW